MHPGEEKLCISPEQPLNDTLVGVMRRWKKTTPSSVLLFGVPLLLVASPAAAAPGPGLGNLDCSDAEYFQPFAFIENDSGPMGTNVSVMIRGYFMTIFAPDSGHPPGEIGIYDVSNPKQPVEVNHIEGGDTDVFREAHSLPVALIDGKYYIAIQTISGVQIWDFTDPLTAERVGNIDLPGVDGGDYENVAWQTSWQGRYLYVSGGNRGVFVVDTVDPQNPQLIKQVATSTSGGFRVGPLFALGDYLVISNMDQDGAYAVLDISVPSEPALLSQVSGLARIYASVVGGDDRIYAAGRDGNFLTHSFTNPTQITPIKDAPIGQDQLYAAAQDSFVFLGRQNNVVKVDVSDEQNPVVVGEGTLNVGHPDHGQVTPMGNLIFIGNDHGTGSAFFCHQYGMDTTPPSVQSTYPKDGTTGVATTARVSVLLSDYIDTETLTLANVFVQTAEGEAQSGILTYAFNTLSFSPDNEFSTDTTYELVLSAGGITDVMGNALEEELVVRFSTGDTVVVPPPPPEEPPAAGGASSGGSGGLSGGGGASIGGGSASGGTRGIPSNAVGGSSTGGIAAGGSATGGSTVGGGGLVGGGSGAMGTGASGPIPGGTPGSCSTQPGAPSRRGGTFGLLGLAAYVLLRKLRLAC